MSLVGSVQGLFSCFPLSLRFPPASHLEGSSLTTSLRYQHFITYSESVYILIIFFSLISIFKISRALISAVSSPVFFDCLTSTIDILLEDIDIFTELFELSLFTF